MAPVGIAERVRIVLENVDFPGQTFFPQPFFSSRQTGFKKPLTGFIVDDEIENVIALGGGILRMAAGVLVKPSAVYQKSVGGPAVRNETFKNIPQHLLHRQIDSSVRRKNETVLILQTEDPSSQGAGLQHARMTRIPASPAFFNRRTRSNDDERLAAVEKLSWHDEVQWPVRLTNGRSHGRMLKKAVSKAAGVPSEGTLRISMSRERSMGKGASRRAGVGRVRRATFSAFY